MRPARAAREVGASLRAAPAAARWAPPDDACSPRATRRDPCQAAATSTMHASAAARAGTGSHLRCGRAPLSCAAHLQGVHSGTVSGMLEGRLCGTCSARADRGRGGMNGFSQSTGDLDWRKQLKVSPPPPPALPTLLLLPPRRRRSRGDGLSSLRSDLPHAVACPVTCLRARPRHTSPTVTVRRAITHGVWR